MVYVYDIITSQKAKNFDAVFLRLAFNSEITKIIVLKWKLEIPEISWQHTFVSSFAIRSSSTSSSCPVSVLKFMMTSPSPGLLRVGTCCVYTWLRAFSSKTLVINIFSRVFHKRINFANVSVYGNRRKRLLNHAFRLDYLFMNWSGPMRSDERHKNSVTKTKSLGPGAIEITRKCKFALPDLRKPLKL